MVGGGGGSAEALYSAVYVENYLESTENLPTELQRHLSRIRQLDVVYGACFRDAEVRLHRVRSDGAGVDRHRLIQRIQRDLIAAQNTSDDKLTVLQELQDLIFVRTRRLDLDKKNLDVANGSCKDDTSSCETGASNKESSEVCGRGTSQQSGANGSRRSCSPQHVSDRDRDRGDKDKSGERASKRARRGRGDNGDDKNNSNGDRDQNNASNVSPSNDSSQRNATSSSVNKKNAAGKLAAGKKKKRKSRQSGQSARDETPPPEEHDPIDPDEPTYCLCVQISYGEMILCDNDLCPIEWFHFSCVSLTTKPKGKWFCPMCRGDRPNVMKPKGQFLKELERYNKEKEENS